MAVVDGRKDLPVWTNVSFWLTAAVQRYLISRPLLGSKQTSRFLRSALILNPRIAGSRRQSLLVVTPSPPPKQKPRQANPAGLIRYRAISGREWDDPAILDAVRALK